MRIIKLDAIDSTNTYLKNVMLTEVLDDYTVVVAKKQLEGRGQRGANWESEAGKNLTISVLKKFDTLNTEEQFLLNIVVSTAVYLSLKELQIPNLRVKWPNDILSGNHKISGILIENILEHKKIQATIIGIGLNVNQTLFPRLARATSIQLLMGNATPLDEVMHLVLKNLKMLFAKYEGKHVSELKSSYEALLFRKDKPSTFKDSKGEIFMGFIRGISDSGRLRIEIEDGLLKECDLKEVQLMY